MAAKPPDIRIIKGDIRKPDYSANYSRFHFPFLIKLQAFFSLSFLYPVPAGAGESFKTPYYGDGSLQF
jgi:hypothetical protein